MPQSLLIRQFVHDVMARAGLRRLDRAWRQQFADELSHEVARKIGVAALHMLDDEGKEAYRAFSNQFHRRHPTAEEVDAFFRMHVPDYQVRVKHLLHEFEEEFLDSMKVR